MFKLTLDPITGKATLDGISIETVEGLTEALAQQTTRIEGLEISTTEDKEKLNLALQDIASLFTTVAYLQSAVNELKANSTPTPTPAPTLLDRSLWTATASNSHWNALFEPQACIDASEANRYISGIEQYTGMWFEINFNAVIQLREIEIDWDPPDYARKFRLLSSADGQAYGATIFSGVGIDPAINAPQRIQFSPIQTGKIRLEITENFGNWLAIRQFRGYS
jgi:hypothetical protein